MSELEPDFSAEAANLTGRWIAGAIKRAGISVKELSRRSGINRPMLYRLINSKQIARLDSLLRVLAACNLEVTELGVKEARVTKDTQST